MPRSNLVTYAFVGEKVILLATGPVEAILYMTPSWDSGTKVCSNGPCHMNRMAAMTIYGKTLQKSSMELASQLL